MKHLELSRRKFLQLAAGAAGGLAAALAGCRAPSITKPRFALATFSADVTVPLGHPLMGGGIAPAQRIDDPLFARGVVLLGGDAPLVIVSVDWCEIRNEAYERWRRVLAEAAHTEPARVLVASVHVHDAPVADLAAERILRAAGAAGGVCDPEFHEQAVQRVAAALREGLRSTRPITHLGLGGAQVKRVASNRRFRRHDGTLSFNRTSSSSDPSAHAAGRGTIDPWLRTLSWWDGRRPVAALHAYATHPMSYYGRGGVSSDFVGLARQRRQADDPTVFQLYTSGCSGNVTAGKYNDGSPANRPILGDRLYRAMRAAWQATRRVPLGRLRFRVAPLRLEPRNSPGFTLEDLQRRLTSDPKPFGQCLAALGLSWRNRADAGHTVDVPALDFGAAQLLLLPAEAYVEYQLFAQRQRPDSFVVTLGYGECAPGYIPIERAWKEGDTNLHDWCWVAPGAEERMKGAIRGALRG
jgi:hypothetical protein